MTSFQVRTPRDEAEYHGFLHHAADAFLGSFVDSLAWAERTGVQNIRIVHDGTRVVGGLALLPSAQYFGGRAVPSVQVAGVAIGAEYRGHGAASALMQSVLEEARENGHVTSMLYPSTHALYRNVGYEVAGELRDIAVRLPEFGRGDRSLPMREATPDDFPALEALYRARAVTRTGHLERSPFHWHGARNLGKVACRTSLVEEEGVPTGYLTYHQRLTGGVLAEMRVRECIASTPAALQRIVGFITQHGCQISDVVFLSASPDHEAILAMRQPFVAMKRHETWMLRLVDVPAALVERGYADDLSTEVHFEIDDPSLLANSGRYQLIIEDGEASVEAGGEGDVRLDVRGLAALYSGYVTPRGIELAGLGTGLEHLPAAVFAGPAPICADYV